MPEEESGERKESKIYENFFHNLESFRSAQSEAATSPYI
jgi:hypothetical protein